VIITLFGDAVRLKFGGGEATTVRLMVAVSVTAPYVPTIVTLDVPRVAP
jgi:hypothetical protein